MAARQPAGGRPWATALLGLFLFLMLTGFATMESTFRVTEDEDVDWELFISMDKEVYAALQESGVFSLEDLETQWAGGEGVTVEPFENADRVGFRAVRTFAGGVAWEGGPFQGSFARRGFIIWDDYVLDLTVDLTHPMYATDIETFTIAVELPVPAQEHNGAAANDGRRVLWTLRPGEKRHLTLQTRAYDWWGASYVLAPILMAIGATANLRELQRKERERQAQVMAGGKTGEAGGPGDAAAGFLRKPADHEQ